MEVRFFKRSERQLMLDSIDRLWRHNHVYVRRPEVLEHLVWNTPYRAAFAGEENYSYIGMWDEDGEVVGLLGSTPQEMNAFGRTYPSNTFTTWIVDKTKNRHANGLDMVHYVFEHADVEMLLNIGISEMVYPVYRFFLKCDTLRDFPRWIAVNRKEETMRVFSLPEEVAPYLPQLQPIAVSSPRYHVAVDAFDAAKWDAYYKKTFAPVSIGTKKDAKFLDWRYRQEPVLSYHFLTVEDAEGVHGLAVVRVESILGGAYKIGRVLEFMALAAEPSVLLADAVARFDPEVLMWDFYCLSDITAFGLEAVGFRKLPAWLDKTMMPTRFQPVDHENLHIRMAVGLGARTKDLVTPINGYEWYVTKGDADQDRAN